VEQICEENPQFGRLEEARALRKDLERAIAAHASGDGAALNLFGELYALAGSAPGFEAGLGGVLESLRTKTRSAGAFLALCLPGRERPHLQAQSGMDDTEATALAGYFAGAGLQPLVLAHVDGALAEAFPGLAARASAVLVLPLTIEDRVLGLVYLERGRAQGTAFAQDEVDFVATYAGLAGVLLYESLREEFQVAEPTPEREALHPALRRVVTADASMVRLLALSQKVASSNCTVLLAGETGTGKGLLAHCIHLMSERRSKRFIALNCAALPEPLLESELFGHVRGAFTGADSEKMGLLEAANGGTVFLDEVGKTSLFMQGKLLQFLDSMEVRPVGANVFKKVDVRVLCASKGNLRELVEQGLFLEDLYYRLNDFPIGIPPLRARRGDIRLLAEQYLVRFAAEMHKPIPGFSRQAMQILEGYAWPGNVRELEKCVKRAVILADDRQPITVRHLPDEVKSPGSRAVENSVTQEGLTLREHVSQVESQVIRSALRRSAGNKSEAARMLGISYPSLLQKIKLYGAAGQPEA
jgi:transcriptional regulator with GAF, ATPase, and Fis domain